jgi:predicted DNA-binding transcriptional regulator YafY
VGQRSNTETLAAILKAFLDARTWKQADLARRVGVQASTIRKHLEELRISGIPLHSEKDHPHVYWSVPRHWFPGGIVFTGAQITELFRQLSRLPKSTARSQLLESLLEFLPPTASTGARSSGNSKVVAGAATAREEQFLSVIEDAAHDRVSLRFRYFTATRGSEATRHASVHCVIPSPPARFVATCHRTGDLKWFRIENVSEAKLDGREPFRAAAEDAVDAHLRGSLDGFHQGGKPERHLFFVSDPDARWVARNLMDDMRCEEVPGGIRVTLETTAVQRLARFVVGLGGSAKPLTPALTSEVALLANGALRSMG